MVSDRPGPGQAPHPLKIGWSLFHVVVDGRQHFGSVLQSAKYKMTTVGETIENVPIPKFDVNNRKRPDANRSFDNAEFISTVQNL